MCVHVIQDKIFATLQKITSITLPYFPVDNAHPVFSVLTNFFNRYRAPYVYRAPENTWNRTTGCGQARI
jgi:hypothetical protein